MSYKLESGLAGETSTTLDMKMAKSEEGEGEEGKSLFQTKY